MRNWQIVKEEFRSFDHLVNVLASRQNNEIMQYETSSQRVGNSSWYGTESYEEAINLLFSGYLSVVDRMKKDVARAAKLNSKYVENVDHARPTNCVYGYAPNVPNAIRGIPESMIYNNKKPMKCRTLEIIYFMSGLSDKSQSYFENAGIALLSAVDFIEKSGIQTKINLVFKASADGNEVTLPMVCIKNYGERFSIQKVSFPLVHTSMFRRFGFRWLETSPDVRSRGWSDGYGQSLDAMQCEEVFSLLNRPNCACLGTAWINDHACDVHQVLTKLGVL